MRMSASDQKTVSVWYTLCTSFWHQASESTIPYDWLVRQWAFRAGFSPELKNRLRILTFYFIVMFAFLVAGFYRSLHLSVKVDRSWLNDQSSRLTKEYWMPFFERLHTPTPTHRCVTVNQWGTTSGTYNVDWCADKTGAPYHSMSEVCVCVQYVCVYICVYRVQFQTWLIIIEQMKCRILFLHSISIPLFYSFFIFLFTLSIITPKL